MTHQERNLMSTTAPLETKVAASSGAAFAVSTVFDALNYWWHVPLPPLYLTGAITFLVTLAAGYLAPHTSRLKPLGAVEAAALDRALAVPPAVSHTGPPGALFSYENRPAGATAVRPPSVPGLQAPPVAPAEPHQEGTTP